MRGGSPGGDGMRPPAPGARLGQVESPSRSRLLFERDLFGKPLRTFPDHALIAERLDLQQRESAEDTWHIGWTGRMQERLVEIGKRGHAQQPETAHDLVLEQF